MLRSQNELNTVSVMNPVLVKIILSVSEIYLKVYYDAQHTFCVVSILPLAEHDLLK